MSMDAFHRLGLNGLPAALNALRAGSVYLIASPGPAFARALMFSCLPACEDAPVLCATAHMPLADHDTSMLDRRLNGQDMLLVCPRKGKRTDGRLARCLEELGHHRVRLRPDHGGMTLVLDAAQHYLPLQDVERALRLLAQARRWAARTRNALVLLVESRGLGAAEQAVMTRLGRDCAGLAWARMPEDTVLSWQINHWQGAPSVFKGELFALEMRPDGGLGEPEAQTPAAREALTPQAEDQDRVLTTHACMSGNLPPFDDWLLYDDLPQLMEAARHAVAATILLDTASSKREALGQTIHRLRQRSGTQLKIIVREIGNRRLRQNEEQLLLRLGANAVLPAELRFASVVGIVRALRQAVYKAHSRLEQPDLHAASQPAADRGYVPPERFIEAVSATVQRSRAVNIGNVLIRLQPAQGASPLDLLKLGRFQRTGDLCTLDHDYAYLFLFACRPSDVDAALNHLFRMAIGEIAEAEVRSQDPESILLALSQLATRPGFAELPDLSDRFAQPERQEHPMVSQKHNPSAELTLRRAPLVRKNTSSGH